MSFKNQQKAVKPRGHRYLIVDQKQDYNGLDKGTYTFIMGFGLTDKKGVKDFMTPVELREQVLRWNKATLWVTDGENNIPVNWHFTLSSHDPLVELGYAYFNDSGQEVRFGTTKKRDEEKLKTLTKVTFQKFLKVQYYLPALMVQETNDGYDVANGEYVMLIVPESQVEKIFKLAEQLKGTKDNKSIMGRTFQLVKDPSKGINTYQWSMLQLPSELTDEMKQKFQEMYEHEEGVLENIYQEVNGGDFESQDEAAEHMWNVLLQKTGLSREQFFIKYNILEDPTVNPNPVHEVDFSQE